MANSQPVTCQIRYTLDLAQLGAFETLRTHLDAAIRWHPSWIFHIED